MFDEQRDICKDCVFRFYTQTRSSSISDRLQSAEQFSLIHQVIYIPVDFFCDQNNVPTSEAVRDFFEQNAARFGIPLRLTLGDLHGNSLTLINILTQFGLLSFRPDDYLFVQETIQNAHSALTQFSQQAPQPGQTVSIGLTEDTYTRFHAILNHSVTPNGLSLLLLGDIVGDRTSNDALMLATIGALRRNGISVSIVFSNHDKNLIDFLQSGNFAASRIALPIDSMTRFIEFLRLIWANMSIRQRIFDDIKEYLRCLVLFEYELSPSTRPDGMGRGMYFFSHAALHPKIGLLALYECAEVHSSRRRAKLIDELTSDEIISLVREANGKFKNMIFAITNRWLTSVLLNSHSDDPIDLDRFGQSSRSAQSFEHEFTSCVAYPDMFGSSRLCELHPDSPDESSPVLERVGFLAVWARLRVFSSTDSNNDLDANIPIDRNMAIPVALLPAELRDGVRFRNVHGHDTPEDKRGNDISLDNHVGKGVFISDILRVLITFQYVMQDAQAHQVSRSAIAPSAAPVSSIPIAVPPMEGSTPIQVPSSIQPQTPMQTQPILQHFSHGRPMRLRQNRSSCLCCFPWFQRCRRNRNT